MTGTLPAKAGRIGSPLPRYPIWYRDVLINFARSICALYEHKSTARASAGTVSPSRTLMCSMEYRLIWGKNTAWIFIRSPSPWPR